jgi:hypothetical protein
MLLAPLLAGRAWLDVMAAPVAARAKALPAYPGNMYGRWSLAPLATSQGDSRGRRPSFKPFVRDVDVRPTVIEAVNGPAEARLARRASHAGSLSEAIACK